MEVLSGPRRQLLWEDIVYAVLSVANQEDILEHLRKKFKISEEEFLDLSEIVLKSYKKSQIDLIVKKIRLLYFSNIDDGQEDLVCVVRIGEQKTLSKEGDFGYALSWNSHSVFHVEDLWNKNIEIEIWQNEDKEQKSYLGRVWLRSLDNFSKKIIRLSLRNQQLPSINSGEDLEGKDASPCRDDDEASDKTSSSSCMTSGEGDAISKKDSFNSPENSWLMTAFSSLKRSSLRKRSTPVVTVNNHDEFDYIDLRSTIPTGRDSFRSAHPPGSTDGKNMSPKMGALPVCTTDCHSHSASYERDHIKTKPEVEVRRQLFPIRSASHPPYQYETVDSKSLQVNKTPLHEVKSLPKLESAWNFQRLDKQESHENQFLSSPKNEKNHNLTKGLSTPSLKTPGTPANQPTKSEFHFLKRMSLLKDRKLSPSFSDPIAGEQNSLQNELELQRDLNEDDLHHIKTKKKTFYCTLKLNELFLKVSCPSWTAESEHILIPTNTEKTSTPMAASTKVAINFQFRAQVAKSSMASFNLLLICLKQLMTSEDNFNQYQWENMETEIFLPLSDLSKTLLKCLCFTYNVSEHYLSLACWLVLVKGRSLDYLSGMTMNATSEGDDAATAGEARPFGLCGEVHPTYFFHWLDRVEISLNLSSYSQKENQMIGYSLVDFVDYQSEQLERIHAMFPVNQANHLSFGLRIIQLLGESKSLQATVRESGLQIEDGWPKNKIISAVLNHSVKWTEALEKEIASVPSSGNGFTTLETHHQESANYLRQKQVHCLTQAIMSGEKALLAINDFVGLGEKVYEAIFKKELDVSYLEIIWPNMASMLGKTLEQIQVALQGKDLYEMFIEGSESLQDLHTSLWVLLLQLSKLQRFQTFREKLSASVFLFPDIFFETFFLLCRLWLRFCLIRLEETAVLECQIDSLSPSALGDDEGYGSSAAEITDLINVVREKISRFSFPPTKKFKDNLALFLEDGIVPVVEKYQHELCGKALKSTVVANALTLQMCVAINSIEKVCKEAESLISTLSCPSRKPLNRIESFSFQVKKGSFFIFSKSLPNLPTWLENALSGNEKEDYLLDWIKSVLDKLLVDAAPQSHLFSLFLQQFWHYIFALVEEKQKTLNQSRDFRVLENFMKKLYYNFKVTLGVTLSQESEIAYQSFMEVMQLKASPTSNVIQAYYTERFEEQTILKSNRKPLVINAYFCKDKGLKVNVYMCPFVETHKRENEKGNRSLLRFASLRRRSTLEIGLHNLVTRHFKRDFKVTTQVKRKAASMFEALTHSSGVGFYVKVSVVPSPWFGRVSAKKTKSTQRNPPVFEDQFSFNINSNDEGVRRGGFLLFRLKYTSRSLSVVDSEAVLPLRKIPVLSAEEKMENKHTFLTVSSPSSVQDYKTLQELASRTQDREALTFLTHLEESYWSYKSVDK